MKKVCDSALTLEKVFGTPQDIEWGLNNDKIYIFQSRNITTLDRIPKLISYKSDNLEIIGDGIVACRGIAEGILKVINNVEDYDKIEKNDIVYVNGNISNLLIKKFPIIGALLIGGGKLSHMAVIAREFNVPCLVEPELYNKEIIKYANKKIIVDTTIGKILLT